MSLFVFVIMFSNGVTVVTPGLAEEQCHYIEKTIHAMYQSMAFRNELPDSVRTKCVPPNHEPVTDPLHPYHLDVPKE